MSSTSFTVSYRDIDHCKRLADPYSSGTYHLELLLPFTQAAKLPKGNANVRPPSEKKAPVKEMEITVESSPESFHLKNRGITYLCDRFENDNATKTVTIHIPSTTEGADEDAIPRFGIADGGHTYHVIEKTVQELEELRQKEKWVEPFVRVHLISGKVYEQAPQIVEALNTSTQVKQVTLDEYQGEFDELKAALQRSGFDIDNIAFRENEPDKEWTVEEILQRLACFLKDRWQETPPASMYKSKAKALDLYVDKKTRPEFFRLFDIVGDLVTLPEFIQSRLSSQMPQGRAPRPIRVQKTPFVRPGTHYPTRHLFDAAAVLPMAAAFRELLQLKGDRYHWRVSFDEVFGRCSEALYRALVRACRDNGSVSALGSDTEYWKDCSQVVMRAFSDLREERLAAAGL